MRATGSLGRKQIPAAKVFSPSAVGWRQLEVDDLAQQIDRELKQNARAVTTVGFGAGGAAMFEVLQRRQSIGNDGVGTAALDVGDHGNAARVRLVLGVVQTLRIWQCRKQHWVYLRSPETIFPGLHRPEERVYQRRCGATRR